MSMIGYMRILTRVKCKNCGHKCYDRDFETPNYYRISENTWKAENNLICPVCKSRKGYEIIENE